MKCINKKSLLTGVILCSILLSGCGNKEYTFAYNPDTTVTGFQVTESQMITSAEPFASQLCVSEDDVVEGTTVSLEDNSSAGLFDLSEKQVLYANGIHEQRYPASLTKVMTALVALKYGNPNDIITVSSNVVITESGAQLCGLKEGDTLTLTQALHALLMNSANDAGVAIAEHIGGSLEEFSEMMNNEARSIGATNSNFVNPHGLHSDNHFTTAYDLYLIFNEAMKYELFSQIIQMTSYSTTYSDKSGGNKELKFETTNQYLKGTYDTPENITVIGGKTGTTNAARNCLILLAKDTYANPYISIILGCSKREILYEEMTTLLEEITK